MQQKTDFLKVISFVAAFCWISIICNVGLSQKGFSSMAEKIFFTADQHKNFSRCLTIANMQLLLMTLFSWIKLMHIG